MCLPADEDILLVGIEAEDVVNFLENCTPAVQAALGEAVHRCMAALDEPC